MTIAISAATGQLGRLALRALASRGGAAIALARDPARAADLGLPVRAFDYTAPNATALAGVTTLVLISSNDFNDRVGQHRSAIDAARTSGVGHIVYTSILKGPASPLLLAQDHIATEAYLAATGIPHTLLRNGWYTENYTGSLGASLAAGAMIGSAGDGRVATAARADYAEAIAAVLTTPGALGQTYELAGDTAYTLADLAAEVSRQTGRTLPYNSLPEAVYAGILQGFGLPEGFARMLADSDAQAAKGALADDSRSLSRLIGRPTTPAADTVAAALAAL
jgi:NAD(P)H dehydrogenase (quinone)